jgi:hypothetical protein
MNLFGTSAALGNLLFRTPVPLGEASCVETGVPAASLSRVCLIRFGLPQFAMVQLLDRPRLPRQFSVRRDLGAFRWACLDRR